MSEGTEHAEGPRPIDSVANRALASLSDLPPLALVAVLAALFEMLLARGIWHGFADVIDSLQLVEIRRWGRFPRNLAAVSGVIALVFGSLTFLRAPGFASIGRRLAISAFSGIFIPCVVVAAALPHAALKRRLVIFGFAAANVLVTLLGMTAVRYRGPKAARLATLSVASTCFVSLLVVGLSQIAQGDGSGPFGALSDLFAHHPTTTQKLLLGVRHFGEVCWFIALVSASGLAAIGGDTKGLRGRILRFAIVASAFVVALLALRLGVGHRFRLLLFGAFRFGLFVDWASWIYALPLGIGFAGGFLALFRRETPLRQIGAGALLWLVGGFAPHTPIQLLYLVLSALLITRSAQALDPDGDWRSRNPWRRFEPRAEPQP